MQDVVLFIDWLGLTLKLKSSPTDIKGHVWRDYTSTNVWKKRRVLWNEYGERVCTLLSKPFSSTIPSDSALLEIDNEWLYHGGGTKAILDKLKDVCIFEIVGISRLDLAVDFVPTNVQEEIIRGLASGEYYVQGKRNGSGFWCTDRNEKLPERWRTSEIPHCQSWGHKTSSIKWKLYYKSKELYDDAGGKFMSKPYIVDHWRMHGFDVNDVWRLEVSMQHLNNYNLYGEKIDLKTVRDQRADLFLSMYNSRFVVRANEGHKDRTNDTIIDFLPLSNAFRHVKIRPPRAMAERHGRITLLRHLVKSLEDEHVLLDKRTREDVLAHIGRIIERDRMHNYFRMITGYWYNEFVQKINECAGHSSDSTKSPVVTKDEIKANTSFEDLSKVMKRVENEEKRCKDEFDEWKEKVRREAGLSYTCIQSGKKGFATVKYYGSNSGTELLPIPDLP